MRTALLATFAGLGLAALASGAQAAPHITIDCPADARSAVTYVGDPGWTTTNQSSRAVGARIENIGGQTALTCIYAMFGTEYWIYRRIDPAYPVCRPASYRANAFDCTTA